MRSQAKLGTNMGKFIVGWRKSVKIFTMFHDVSRFFTFYHQYQARNLASQARYKLRAPNWSFACAKRGRDFRAFSGSSLFSETGDF